MLDRLVEGHDCGGLRNVGFGEEERVLLHRDKGNLDLVVALDGHLALVVRDVLDGKQTDALRVDVERHIGLAHGHDTRLHHVAGIEALAVVSQLVVQHRGEIHHRSFLVHDTSLGS